MPNGVDIGISEVALDGLELGVLKYKKGYVCLKVQVPMNSASKERYRE